MKITDYRAAFVATVVPFCDRVTVAPLALEAGLIAPVMEPIAEMVKVGAVTELLATVTLAFAGEKVKPESLGASRLGSVADVIKRVAPVRSYGCRSDSRPALRQSDRRPVGVQRRGNSTCDSTNGGSGEGRGSHRVVSDGDTFACRRECEAGFARCQRIGSVIDVVEGVGSVGCNGCRSNGRSILRQGDCGAVGAGRRRDITRNTASRHSARCGRTSTMLKLYRSLVGPVSLIVALVPPSTTGRLNI